MQTTVLTHLPGTIFVLASGGWAGRIIRIGTNSRVNHAGMCLGDGLTIEGEPGGARIGHEQDNERVIYGDALWSEIERQRPGANREMAVAAHALQGTPYNWLNIADDAFSALSFPQRWLEKIVDNNHMLICSSLVDQAAQTVGVHLFTDGRKPGRVNPGDLEGVIANGGKYVVVDPRATP